MNIRPKNLRWKKIETASHFSLFTVVLNSPISSWLVVIFGLASSRKVTALDWLPPLACQGHFVFLCCMPLDLTSNCIYTLNNNIVILMPSKNLNGSEVMPTVNKQLYDPLIYKLACISESQNMSEKWTQTNLQQYISDKTQESLALEYKGAASLDKADKKKTEITKDVSSMANSAGGIIIYGIKEYDEADKRHLPEKIDPIQQNVFSKEWLE